MFVQGGLTFSNFPKHPLIYSDSHWGDWSFVLRIKSPKSPVATGLVPNRRLFRKMHYQTRSGETFLSSDYNVLRSTVIVLNNFIQYSHCQSVQAFRLTPYLIKALTTNHI